MSNSTLTNAAYLNQLSTQINFYFNIISSSISIPCNLVNLVIYWRLMSNKTNMGFLGICQTSIDLIVLLLFLLVYRTTFGISFSNTSNIACSLLTYLRRIILHVSSWISVVTTFDRFIFLVYGNEERFKFMKKKLYLSLIILGITVVISILDIPNLFFYLINNSCNADFVPYISSDLISICLRTYFPFALMIVFNTLMIRNIFKKRAVLKQSSRGRKEYYFTFAVIAYDTYFFILNFPMSLYYIMYDANKYSGTLNTNALLTAQYSVFGIVSNSISFCVQTLSFFMYLSFNKLFRLEFLQVIYTILRISRLRRVEPSRTTARNNTLGNTTNH